MSSRIKPKGLQRVRNVNVAMKNCAFYSDVSVREKSYL